LEYAGPGGWYHRSDDVVVIVKVNPRDAVSVPIDHSAQKLRVCRYEVVGVYDRPLDDDYEETPQNDDDDEEILSAFYADEFYECKYHTEYLELLDSLCANGKDVSLIDVRNSRSHYNYARRSDVFTKLETFFFTDKSTLAIRYNTDDTCRWICAKDGDENTLAFYRFSEAY
jgi:hypothetical protein